MIPYLDELFFFSEEGLSQLMQIAKAYGCEDIINEIEQLVKEFNIELDIDDSVTDDDIRQQFPTNCKLLEIAKERLQIQKILINSLLSNDALRNIIEMFKNEIDRYVSPPLKYGAAGYFASSPFLVFDFNAMESIVFNDLFDGLYGFRYEIYTGSGYMEDGSFANLSISIPVVHHKNTGKFINREYIPCKENIITVDLNKDNIDVYQLTSPFYPLWQLEQFESNNLLNFWGGLTLIQKLNNLETIGYYIPDGKGIRFFKSYTNEANIIKEWIELNPFFLYVDYSKCMSYWYSQDENKVNSLDIAGILPSFKIDNNWHFYLPSYSNANQLNAPYVALINNTYYKIEPSEYQRTPFFDGENFYLPVNINSQSFVVTLPKDAQKGETLSAKILTNLIAPVEEYSIPILIKNNSNNDYISEEEMSENIITSGKYIISIMHSRFSYDGDVPVTGYKGFFENIFYKPILKKDTFTLSDITNQTDSNGNENITVTLNYQNQDLPSTNITLYPNQNFDSNNVKYSLLPDENKIETIEEDYFLWTFNLKKQWLENNLDIGNLDNPQTPTESILSKIFSEPFLQKIIIEDFYRPSFIAGIELYCQTINQATENLLNLDTSSSSFWINQLPDIPLPEAFQNIHSMIRKMLGYQPSNWMATQIIRFNIIYPQGTYFLILLGFTKINNLPKIKGINPVVSFGST